MRNSIDHILAAFSCETQEEFAKLMQVNPSTVSRWGRGGPISHRHQLGIRAKARTLDIEWNDSWFFEVPAETGTAA